VVLEYLVYVMVREGAVSVVGPGEAHGMGPGRETHDGSRNVLGRDQDVGRIRIEDLLQSTIESESGEMKRIAGYDKVVVHDMVGGHIFPPSIIHVDIIEALPVQLLKEKASHTYGRLQCSHLAAHLREWQSEDAACGPDVQDFAAGLHRFCEERDDRIMIRAMLDPLPVPGGIPVPEAHCRCSLTDRSIHESSRRLDVLHSLKMGMTFVVFGGPEKKAMKSHLRGGEAFMAFCY
jgi:hypothetical protein